MLFYKDGKIRIGSVDVRIPDGVYIETHPEMSYDQGLELVAPNEEYRIVILGDNDKKNALRHLNSVTQGVGYKHLDKPESIILNGLKGWQLRYGEPDDPVIYYEVVFDIPETEEARILDIYLRAATPVDMQNIINGRIVQELLNGITLA